MRRKCSICGVEWTCVGDYNCRCTICIGCLTNELVDIKSIVYQYAIALLRCKDSLVNIYTFKKALSEIQSRGDKDET